MRTFSFLFISSLMVVRLHAHIVVWRENPDGTHPTNAMVLDAGVPQFISVKPVINEDCTVEVALDPLNSTLIEALVSPPNPAANVDIKVSLLRNPAGGFEMATINGKWRATGLKADGTPDPVNCDAIFWTSFAVPVNVLSRLSGDNHPDSATDGDPVNLFTGEFIMEEGADIDLGGPMPLIFSRYYASGLARDNLVQSALGPNWSCNFDWRAIRDTNQVDVVTWKGRRVRFQRASNTWQLVGSRIIPYQLQDSGADVVLADPRDQHQYTFNTNGLLTAISDGHGHTQTLNYNGGLLVQASDGLGRTLLFTNNSFNQLVSLTNGQRTVGFTHNGSYLYSVTDAMTNVTTYTYDSTNSIPGLLTAKTMPRGNVSRTQTYDNNGRVITQTTADNHTRSFAYQANNTASVADGSGPPRTFVHNNAGQLLSFTDENGRMATIASDANGEPTAIVDRAGNRSGIAWHGPSGKPAAITNADGFVTRFDYGSRVVGGITNYDLAQVTFYDGTSELFTYDSSGNVLTRSDRATNVWRFRYNNRGEFLAVTNPAGGVLTQTLNSDGTVATRTDGETGTSAFAYDSWRHVSAVTNADGSIRRFIYDALDRVVTLTDERNNSFLFSYDSNGNLSTITDPIGGITRLTYDAMDRLVQHTDRLGAITRAAFDEEGHLSSITNRNGFVAGFLRDTAHRLSRITDPAGRNWDYGYDDESGLISFTDPLGSTSRGGFDSLRYLSHQINALGQTLRVNRDSMGRIAESVDQMSRTNRFTYESRGLLAGASQPVVGAASYQYNNLGLLNAVQDPTGRNWTLAYSPWGRLTGTTDPLNRSKTMTYDARGRLQRIVFPDGATRTNTYDGANNLTRAQHSGGPDLQYGYDALNRLVTADNLAFTYDAEGRVINTASSGVNFGAAWDADGRLTNVTYLSGALTVNYTYDSRDRLTRVRDSLTGAQIDFNYDDAGRLTNVTRANGVNGAYTHDAAGRLTRIKEGGIIDIQYTLNAAAEVTAANFTAPLDPAGFTNPIVGNFAYDAAHQVTGAGFAYDTRGRQTAAPGHGFAWDGASRLVGIDGVTLGYNGANDIVTREQGGVTTRYSYNHALGTNPIVAETDDTSGQVLRYYVWSPGGRLLYLIDSANGNAVRFFHFDRNGSTLALTDSSGTVTDAYAYSPYGALLSRTGTNTQPFTFIGERGVRTETAAGRLYQMRARYYDPSTARFLSPDLVWPNLYRPVRLNPYQYAMQNPLRFIDPNGEKEVDLQFISDDVGAPGYLFSGDWFSSLDDLIAKIKSKLAPDDCIRTLTIVNHGSQGVRGFVQFDSENYVARGSHNEPFFSGQHIQDQLSALSKLFCRDGNIIFRICRAGEGVEGDIVLKAIANLVKVPVQGPEDEIKAAPWGGVTVPWKTVNPDGYVPPAPPTGIAAVTAQTIVK